MFTMKIEVTEEDLPLIIRALDHYSRYKTIMERLLSPSRKQVAIEQGPSKSKSARRNTRRAGWVN